MRINVTWDGEMGIPMGQELLEGINDYFVTIVECKEFDFVGL